jgi:starch synthase (maltosyl-transferring)
MPRTGHGPPAQRPSRAVVEVVAPVVDGGRFPSKATEGEMVTVVADAFVDGHDAVGVAVRWRQPGDAEDASWQERPMVPMGNDRWSAAVMFDRLGRWEYEVLAWLDHPETWRRDTTKKVAAGLDVSVELAAGVKLVSAMGDRAKAAGDHAAAQTFAAFAVELSSQVTTSLTDRRWVELFWQYASRDPVARTDAPLMIDVDPLHARFGSWYEFFPRSSAEPGPETATLGSAVERLDYVASMGFDIVYLPPVHPIGVTKRKGPNNAPVAGDADVGSPWAIGSAAGGHTSVDPDLGTVDDIERLAHACRQRGMYLAMDIAFQCSPDHPWVREHPEWFAHRADGTIQYAENPPKKYEDIYPLDFETEHWAELWDALVEVFRFWIARGVTVFRVDNPHTKSFSFWEWALGVLRAEHPETVYLAEAFTRPRVMERLAKVGFNQSYTYFAWRQADWELREYFTDLSTRTVDYFRPNAWPNTPDILTEQLQTGGRGAFVSRAVLAATLSPSWGIYGPAFELLENEPMREGSEEYLHSEKYQARHWNLDREDSLAPLLTRLNSIRRDQPALGHLRTLQFHTTDSPGLLCYSKTDPAGLGDPVLVVVNLDPFARHAGFVHLDLGALALPPDTEFQLTDLLGGGTYRWRGARNYVDLAPWSASAHVFALQRTGVEVAS